MGKIDHSSAGAQHAIKMLDGPLKPLGRIAAYCIAGHHGGLADAGIEANRDVPGTLIHRLHKRIEPVDIPSELKQIPTIPMPSLQLKLTPNEAAFQVAFWGRMMFSALVDADFLATELHYNACQFNARNITAPNWQLWAKRVDDCVAGKRNLKTQVGRCRDAVYQQCVIAARNKPGFFSLTVPTGGGKTFSSLAFATQHAHRNNLRRVIFALPFTSIIEQNADIIRKVLEDDVVLEHHSNLSPDKENKQMRLAAENWDAPVVVTTNVQFLNHFLPIVHHDVENCIALPTV
ncbi:MAG: DEAD/DEAH box helicase family protein [Phycisphaeraceae bacterium]|nr:DEAD/DEAH box helicase family protein [Phycisphaeraceae bacterium]